MMHLLRSSLAHKRSIIVVKSISNGESSHFVNSHFVNSRFVNIDQMGIDKMGIDKVGITPWLWLAWVNSPAFTPTGYEDYEPVNTVCIQIFFRLTN